MPSLVASLLSGGALVFNPSLGIVWDSLLKQIQSPSPLDDGERTSIPKNHSNPLAKTNGMLLEVRDQICGFNSCLKENLPWGLPLRFRSSATEK